MANKDDHAFDDLDRQIVALLKANGRISNRDIARRLNVPRMTISNRISRMTEASALRIVAATDFAAYGYDVLLGLAVEVQGRSAEDVAADFAALPEVMAVHCVTGAYQLEILIAAHDFNEVSSRVFEHLEGIAGVARIDLGIATDILSYHFDSGAD
jgi:Lrp/AsnC family leucine-responsive transcriptional regulator